MKKTLLALITAFGFVAFAAPVHAQEPPAADAGAKPTKKHHKKKADKDAAAKPEAAPAAADAGAKPTKKHHKKKADKDAAAPAAK